MNNMNFLSKWMPVALLMAASFASPASWGAEVMSSKVQPGAKNLAGSAATLPILAGYKLSRLPMSLDKYIECQQKIFDARGRPRTTDKCAPDFFPYVADPKRKDALMNIIGNHDYAFNGQEYTIGFSPPFKEGALATFLVFPPMKQVILVRVDDLGNVQDEERDIMSGAFLSIVNGKVVDQIEGCDIDKNYACIVDGKPVAKLMENGKFKRLVPE